MVVKSTAMHFSWPGEPLGIVDGCLQQLHLLLLIVVAKYSIVVV